MRSSTPINTFFTYQARKLPASTFVADASPTSWRRTWFNQFWFARRRSRKPQKLWEPFSKSMTSFSAAKPAQRLRGRRRVFISIVRIEERLQRTICTWSTLFDVVKRTFSVFLTFLPYLHACYLRLSWKMSFTWSVSVMEASIFDTGFLV